MGRNQLSRGQLIRFYVPISLESLGKFDIAGRAVIPMYVNPDTVQIMEKKIVNRQLVKGGYVVQYWGEELPVLSASGTTGSGGIEAANILRDVYRHEQIHFKRVLLDRARKFADEAKLALQESDAPAETFFSFADELTGGALSQIVDGVSSVIDAVTDAINGNLNTEVAEAVLLTPTPAAFATSVDLVFGQERYRGYFESFQVSENSQNPGIVSYQFTFVITRRWGTRKNYMPWHRNPVDSGGNPRSASLPQEGAATEELSFATRNTTQQSITDPDLKGPNSVSNTFVSDTTIPETNSVPINRLEATKK